MYSRYSRPGRNGWYQSFFWLLVGFLIGQIIRLDIGLMARPSNAFHSPIHLTEDMTHA